VSEGEKRNDGHVHCGLLLLASMQNKVIILVKQRTIYIENLCINSLTQQHPKLANVRYATMHLVTSSPSSGTADVMGLNFAIFSAA